MKKLYLGSAIVAVLGLVACSSDTSIDAPAPLVSEGEAWSMAESMLQAYNSGDYGAWSRDWSDEMKAAIDQATFGGFREQMFAVTGRFLELKSVELKPGEQDPDVARYEFMASFERDDDVLFMIAFYPGSRKIDGVQVEPEP
jgi:hypothetical protein